MKISVWKTIKQRLNSLSWHTVFTERAGEPPKPFLEGHHQLIESCYLVVLCVRKVHWTQTTQIVVTTIVPVGLNFGISLGGAPETWDESRPGWPDAAANLQAGFCPSMKKTLFMSCLKWSRRPIYSFFKVFRCLQVEKNFQKRSFDSSQGKSFTLNQSVRYLWPLWNAKWPARQHSVNGKTHSLQAKLRHFVRGRYN